MDPLSLTANIIAVVSATSSVSKRLQTLCSLRNAPQELLQFYNELSDIQVLLTIVRQTSLSLGDEDSSIDVPIKTHLTDSISRAAGVLDEFDAVISKIGVQLTDDASVFKFSWRAWIQNASRLRELSGALRTTRLDIAQTLTLITASEFPRLRTRLVEVTTQNSNIELALQNMEKNARQEIQGSKAFVDAMRAGAGAAVANKSSPIRFQTAVFSGSSFCDAACFCRCHKFTRLMSPDWDWLQSLFGRVFIGYSGIPSRPTCSEKSCRRSSRCLLTINYYFPRWFLSYCIRMISFGDQWDPFDGHNIVLRTPRILETDSEPALLAAREGNVIAMERLFAQRLASPFDVLKQNFESVLSFAVDNMQPEVCAFLLNEHADPYSENITGCSAVGKLWGYILTQPDRPQALKVIFQEYLDLDEMVQDQGFTMLHRIVLKISPVSLKAQLQTSTAEIDIPCSRGRTPLHWAALQANTDSMATLIEFGASIHLQDNAGNTPLHHVAAYSTFEGLNIILAGIEDKAATSDRNDNFLAFCLEQQSKDGFTPLVSCAFYHDCSEFAGKLLDAGAHVDSSPWNSSGKLSTTPPVLASIQMNRHATMRLLLKRGARLDMFDHEMQGTLHLVALCGDLETIHIITQQDGVKNLDAEHRDMYNQSALQIFDTQRPQIVPEDEATFQECRGAFLLLLQQTRGRSCPKDEEVISEASDEDVFYESKENLTI